MGTQLKHCLLVANYFQLSGTTGSASLFRFTQAIMALMPYQVAGAAFAAGAGYPNM